jgi:ABC-2 type transport system ATP-binding protein
LPGLQIDNPFFEGRDASAIISWASSAANPARTQVKMESPGDPLIGMVGGSYGGGIQWVTAATDPRVDAIAPQISWNSLISSLYPNTNQFKTGWGSILLLALAASGAQINPQIYVGIGTGVTLGWLSETSQAVLSSAGPTALLNNIDIPTLIFQGMEDGLFQLQESVTNAESIYDNPGATTKLVWFCGGHGTCTTPLNPDQDDRGLIDNLKWLDQYLAGSGTPAEDIPAFQWYDQMGFYYSSDKLPFEPGFNLPQPYSTAANGGLLGVWPLLGGSGPGRVEGVSPLLTFPNATPAWNALNTSVTVPADSQVVGAPELSFTYQGLGTSRTVYAQLIDETTGKVLQNLVTPIPVVLDGRERTVSIPLANIAYTSTGGSLRLQITSSATNFENFTSYGLVNISDVTLDLPIVA